jgi:Ca2+-binding RTX toxin-like protein
MEDIKASTLFWYGTAGDDQIRDFYDYYNDTYTNDVMYGGEGDDVLIPIEDPSANVLIGGAGRDTLNALGTSTLRFTAVTDSYRSATSSHSDRVNSWGPTDTLDLVALGITGIGDGYNGTLKVMLRIVADGSEQTYLKSFDEDQNGNRFELAFEGNHVNDFGQEHFQAVVSGTAGGDTLEGADNSQTLTGYAGQDVLAGHLGNDRLDGGAGGDRLSGGEGTDEFVFQSINDSTRNAGAGGTKGRDLITDFDAAQGDLIDLSTLGLKGLGNGYDGTLKVVVNAAGTQTALKSYEEDAQGNHFEVLLEGNLLGLLDRNNVVFANATGGKVVNNLGLDDRDVIGTAANDTLSGYMGHDQILGFQGNDVINGQDGNDAMAGGTGTDRLTGGSGADSFVFYAIEDSYRTATASQTDLITDYVDGDKIYLIGSLDFVKTLDGNNKTLKVDYNADLDRTYLHSLESDAQGRFFQIALQGKHDSSDLTVYYDALALIQEPITIIGVHPDGPAPV